MKCTKCFMYSENPRGSYMKHLVSVMECSGRCSGSLSQVWWLLVGSGRYLCATAAACHAARPFPAQDVVQILKRWSLILLQVHIALF